MKKLLLLTCLAAVTGSAQAQINITAADMPVAGDTLRYSITTGAGINLSATGASTTWNFSTLASTTQTIDTYKTALQVSPVYAATISLNAYGYKVADSIPGIGSFLPVSVKALYTFYSKKNSPSRFVAEGFAASIAGIPTAVNYQDEDEIYFFPLAFGTTQDSSNFSLKFSLATVGSLTQTGYRKTTVDGWGTIVTPYTTSPINCIRVRTEVHEIDTIVFSGIPIGMPRNTVEYKWLANGEHYPLLWVTANLTGSTETISGARYRDYNRSAVGISHTQPAIMALNAYPNPAIDGKVTITIPAGWSNYTVALYDMQSKKVGEYNNTATLDMQQLPAGKYIAAVQHNGTRAFVAISK